MFTQGTMSAARPRIALRKRVLACLAVGHMAVLNIGVQAQPGLNYTFGQSTASYTAITGGTVLISGTRWNAQRFTVVLPSPFWFDGQWYPVMYVTCDGYITLGSSMSGGSTKPISSNTGYAGAISPFGANLEDANATSSELRWQQVGAEIVVQWKDARRKIGGNTESFSFQARLNTSTGVIKFHYGPVIGLSPNLRQQPEVGLRGASNAFPANVLNRRVDTGPETWSTSLPGTANTTMCRFSSASPARSPQSGLQLIFTPPCVLSNALVTTPIACAGGLATVVVGGTLGPLPYAGAGTFQVPAGSHTFTVVDAFGCSSQVVLNIPEPQPLLAAASMSAPITCHGGSGQITVSASGGTPPYSGTGNFIRPAGSYTFTVTDANGCTANATATLSEPTGLIATASMTTPIACNGGNASVTVSASGGIAPYTGTGTFTRAAGSYSFTITDANGCSSMASVTVNEPSALNSSASVTAPINCIGGNATVTVSALGGTAPYTGTGTFTRAAGTYSFPITDTNGCSSIASVTVNQPTALNSSASVTTPISCNGGNATVTVSASGGTAPYTGTGTFTRAAGTYAFTITDANGCSTTANVTVNQPSTLSASASVTVPINCNGGNGTVNVSASGGTGPYTGTGTFTRTAGTYTFTVTDGNGCTTNTSVTITGPTTLSATASLVSPPTGCNTNDAVVLVAASGGTPMYMGTGIMPGLAPGASTFEVKDAVGCMTTAALIIPEADNDGDGTSDCSDGCPNDADKTSPGACGCDVANTNTDGDTFADCVDGCPNDPLKSSPGQCGCGVAEIDSDGDGFMDCVDPCPNGPNPGTACDDGEPFTLNDVIGSDCVCRGTPSGPWMILTLTTDDHGSETSWEIAPATGGPALHAGSGYANNTTYDISCPLPDGAYVLRVMDSAGDGMCCLEGNGGYVLRMSDGRRIIDNANDGAFTLNSSVAQGFTLPLGIDRLTPSRCDRTNYLPSDFIQAVPNAAVRAQFNTGTQTDDGYQFWFFNPDGGYSRKITITHAYNNWWFPIGADRCSYLKLDNIVTNQLPANTLLNVRVRSQVNGVFSEFGPTCRFRIDLVVTCPSTQLIAELTDPQFSCGLTNVLLNGSTTLYSVPVASANRYAWEFSRPGHVRRITSPTSTLNLIEWTTSPLAYNSTYNVRVCASFDNGVSYCPYGSTCQLSLGAPPENGGRTMEGRIADAVLAMWPNPNVGDLLHLQIGGLADVQRSVAVGVYSLTGESVRQEIILSTGTTLNASIALPSGTPSGIYIVSLAVDGVTYSDRLVVQ
jgi:hypothetical protein